MCFSTCQEDSLTKHAKGSTINDQGGAEENLEMIDKISTFMDDVLVSSQSGSIPNATCQDMVDLWVMGIYFTDFIRPVQSTAF